jgi:hypothetical protein
VAPGIGVPSVALTTAPASDHVGVTGSDVAVATNDEGVVGMALLPPQAVIQTAAPIIITARAPVPFGKLIQRRCPLYGLVKRRPRQSEARDGPWRIVSGSQP